MCEGDRWGTDSTHRGKGDLRGQLIAHKGEAAEGSKKRRVIRSPDSRVGA